METTISEGLIVFDSSEDRPEEVEQTKMVLTYTPLKTTVCS